jgi:hypothetical protein
MCGAFAMDRSLNMPGPPSWTSTTGRSRARGFVAPEDIVVRARLGLGFRRFRPGFGFGARKVVTSRSFGFSLATPESIVIGGIVLDRQVVDGHVVIRLVGTRFDLQFVVTTANLRRRRATLSGHGRLAPTAANRA